MKNKLIILIFGLISMIAGYTLLFVSTNWKITLAIFLIHCAINVDTSIKCKK